MVEARPAPSMWLNNSVSLRQPGSSDSSIASASTGIRLKSSFAWRTFSRCMAALLMPVLLRVPSGGIWPGLAVDPACGVCDVQRPVGRKQKGPDTVRALLGFRSVLLVSGGGWRRCYLVRHGPRVVARFGQRVCLPLDTHFTVAARHFSVMRSLRSIHPSLNGLPGCPADWGGGRRIDPGALTACRRVQLRQYSHFGSGWRRLAAPRVHPAVPVTRQAPPLLEAGAVSQGRRICAAPGRRPGKR